MKKWVVKKYLIYYNSRFIRLVIIPIVFAAPPLLVQATAVNTGLKKFFDSHTTLSLWATLWPLGYILFQFIDFSFKEYLPVDTEKLMSLFKTIDKVLGSKIERFGEQAKKILDSNKPVSGEVIFKRITQPKSQISKIANGIWYYFNLEANSSDNRIRVAIAKMGDKYISDWMVFVPEDDGPVGQIEKYQVDECGFSRAKEKGKILIIPDIQKAAKETTKKCNYVIVSEELKDEEGSMICYPVKHRNLNDTPYVISVWSSEKNYFKLAHEKAYDFILNKFAKRIALEHGLLVLKERVGYEEN